LFYLQIHAGALYMMLRHCQVQQTLQMPWQALAEMFLWVIANSENPAKIPLPICRTIVLRCPSDPQCLPMQIRKIPAKIYLHSMLLQNSAK
jgi:hypothetical protein